MTSVTARSARDRAPTAIRTLSASALSRHATGSGRPSRQPAGAAAHLGRDRRRRRGAAQGGRSGALPTLRELLAHVRRTRLQRDPHPQNGPGAPSSPAPPRRDAQLAPSPQGARGLAVRRATGPRGASAGASVFIHTARQSRPHPDGNPRPATRRACCGPFVCGRGRRTRVHVCLTPWVMVVHP